MANIGDVYQIGHDVICHSLKFFSDNMHVNLNSDENKTMHVNMSLYIN